MGAFDYGAYRRGMDGRNDPRLAAALLAIKKELVFRGYGYNVVLNPVFGEAVENRMKEFQAAHALKADGVCGSVTLRELFRARVNQTEQNHGLPRGTLGKKIALESGFDPVALGTADPDDHGIAQINLRIHTSVSVDQAFDPVFAIEWAADYLVSNKLRVEREVNTLKAARASYNIGVEYAKQWMLAGFPASGGPSLGGTDSFARATRYIQLIDSQPW